MRSSCVDEQYCQNIAETAIFLGRVREIDLARALYASTIATTDASEKSQEDRIEADRKEKGKKRSE
jgi:hypothetical protein